MVNANREQSYITFGSGIGNLEPLLFEARLSPSYFFSKNRKRWAILMNPQVQLRMLNKPSFPIRNPSYRVYATFYHELEFWRNSFLERIFFNNALWYASIAHHSNGQDGPFYLADSTKQVNLENGNFSANFLEFGISSYKVTKLTGKYFSIREVKASMEYYPKAWLVDGMENLYGSYRFFAKFGITGPRRNDISKNKKQLLKWLQKSSVEIKVGWIAGKLLHAQPLEASQRLIIDIQYKYYPPWFDEIAFFIRFYQGQDYYNIHFVNSPLTNLSCGITSNIMNFKEAVRLFGR
jgi:hypothetical protein